MHLIDPPLWMQALGLIVIAAYLGLYVLLTRKLRQEDAGQLADTLRSHNEAMARIAFDEGRTG